MGTIVRRLLMFVAVMVPETSWAQWSADTSAIGAHQDRTQRDYRTAPGSGAEAFAPAGNADSGRTVNPARNYNTPVQQTNSQAEYPVRRAAYQVPETLNEPARDSATSPGGEQNPTVDSQGGLPLAQPSAGSEGTTGKIKFDNMPAMVASLGVVLGLFSLTVCLMRRGIARGPLRTLPRDAVEVLGRVPLLGRQYAHLIRCGNKMLLVCATPTGAETLTEITDPTEVDRLAELCHSRGARNTTNGNYSASQPYRPFDRDLASSTLFGDEGGRLDFSHLTGAGSTRGTDRDA